MDVHRIIRIAIALLLLVAGALKTHELLIGSSIDAHYNRWISVIVVQFEFLLAIWLFSDWRSDISWKLTGLVFSCFAIYSLTLAISGYKSCGCFGKVSVNPWWTFLLDLSIVCTLICYRPRSLPHLDRQNASAFTGVCLAAVAVTLILGVVLARTESTTISAAGEFVGDSHIVLLEPNTWLGKTFPLTNHISEGTDFTDGHWVILLYHHDCPMCQEALPRYTRLAATLEQRVALVEVPPYGHVDSGRTTNPSLWRRLSEEREWFVRAPVEIAVEDGIVASVCDDPVATDSQVVATDARLTR